MIEELQTLGRFVVWLIGAYVLVISLFVSLDHLKTWRSDPEKHLLPLHIWTVALSYDLFVLYVLTFFSPLDWRAFVYIPALVIGAFAMTVLAHHQRLVRHD